MALGRKPDLPGRSGVEDGQQDGLAPRKVEKQKRKAQSPASALYASRLRSSGRFLHSRVIALEDPVERSRQIPSLKLLGSVDRHRMSVHAAE